MANPNSASGLWPVRMANGLPYYPHITLCYAPAGYGTGIFLGDPVVLTGTNNVAETLGWDIGRLPEVNVAADGDGDPIHGVCIGVVPVTNESLIYRAASTLRLIEVDTRRDVIWRAQTNADSTAIALTDMGAYGNLKVGTGSTTTGRSGWTIDTTDGPDTTDVSNQILFMGLSDLGPGKNTVGDYAWYDFLINNHGFGNAADAGRFTGA